MKSVTSHPFVVTSQLSRYVPTGVLLMLGWLCFATGTQAADLTIDSAQLRQWMQEAHGNEVQEASAGIIPPAPENIYNDETYLSSLGGGFYLRHPFLVEKQPRQPDMGVDLYNHCPGNGFESRRPFFEVTDP